MAKQRNRKPARRRDKKGGPGSGRRKPCLFCKDKVEQVDYKDVETLRKFISERGQDPLAPHHAAPAAATRARSPPRSSAPASSRCCPTPPRRATSAATGAAAARDRDRDRDRER